MDPQESGVQNPYWLLLHKLTSTLSQKPHLRSPTNVWQKTQQKEIDGKVQKIIVHALVPQTALAVL